MAADTANWRRARFEKDQSEIEIAAEVEEASKTGRWIPAVVARWLE